MPVAHYKIDPSLLLLRTCSVFACQWELWRGEMRLKLLLIDVVDSLGLLDLLTAGQWAFLKPPAGISAEKSNAPFFVPQQSPMLCSPIREHWAALVQSFALRATAEAPGAATDICALHQSVSTPWDHLPSAGQDLQVTLFTGSLSSLALVLSRTKVQKQHTWKTEREHS